MIKVRQLSINPAIVSDLTLYTNNPHLIYLENARGYITYKGNITQVNEKSAILLPPLEHVKISIYCNDRLINAKIFSCGGRKLLRKRIYTEISAHPHINLYTRNFPISLHSNLDERNDYSLFDSVRDLIVNYSQDVDCKLLANLTNSTLQTLNRRLQKHEITCSKLIVEMKMRKARMLLARTSKKISEVSAAVGINQSYFSVLFKNEFGTTPSEFREKLK